MVVHPNNPTGSYIKSEEARQLAEICARREMAIIADEVFLDYADDSGPRPSFAFDGPALTFTLSGLSKISLLPQMKLAWIVVSGPEALAAAAVAATGGDWRLLPFAEHARADRTDRNAGHARESAGANASKALRESGFSRCAVTRRRPGQSAGTRGRMVRGAACPRDGFG